VDRDGRALRVRAATCALEMMARLGACNAELAASGRPPLRVRFGVAAGPVVQGNIGSGARYEHTVVGDTVNRAARLQQNAEPDHVLMDRAIADLVPQVAALGTPLEIRVRGRGGPVPVVDLGRDLSPGAHR
jgi:adenylate cyclase